MLTCLFLNVRACSPPTLVGCFVSAPSTTIAAVPTITTVTPALNLQPLFVSSSMPSTATHLDNLLHPLGTSSFNRTPSRHLSTLGPSTSRHSTLITHCLIKILRTLFHLLCSSSPC